MDNANLILIENKLGYVFRNKELLLRAFTHSSYSNEHKNGESYERLEFLGDATVNFVVGLLLYETFPNYSEGRLSQIRSGMVDRATLSSVIDSLDIAKFIRTGAGNVGQNFLSSQKSKCDLFEAITGAIVMDNGGDIKEAGDFIKKFLSPKINSERHDYKSEFLEYCTKNNIDYEFKELTESPNKLPFIFELYVDGKSVATGKGPNKKSAQRDACQKFFSNNSLH